MYYSYGAPSSDNQLICYGGYTSAGKDSMVLRVPIFDVNFIGPQVTIITAPALNMSSFNQAIPTYRTVQYRNGARTRSGIYYDATSKVSNYSGQRSIRIYGVIREANG
ncbi:hypothetical protein [[Clostridium] polysaccharolyticum]|uniref:hypothetical protein n=1 Tax=[Clostridium] polysaccharolyticum TaxID=29364 RepID=UPI00115F7804|nr:hypothetical protein [[Clostridium] polysaccharolyticum]